MQITFESILLLYDEDMLNERMRIRHSPQRTYWLFKKKKLEKSALLVNFSK